VTLSKILNFGDCKQTANAMWEWDLCGSELGVSRVALTQSYYVFIGNLISMLSIYVKLKLGMCVYLGDGEFLLPVSLHLCDHH